jgi:uncharacterized ion transporter superfamily protein YfcC
VAYPELIADPIVLRLLGLLTWAVLLAWLVLYTHKIKTKIKERNNKKEKKKHIKKEN